MLHRKIENRSFPPADRNSPSLTRSLPTSGCPYVARMPTSLVTFPPSVLEYLHRDSSSSIPLRPNIVRSKLETRSPGQCCWSHDSIILIAREDLSKSIGDRYPPKHSEAVDIQKFIVFGYVTSPSILQPSLFPRRTAITKRRKLWEGHGRVPARDKRRDVRGVLRIPTSS